MDLLLFEGLPLFYIKYEVIASFVLLPNLSQYSIQFNLLFWKYIKTPQNVGENINWNYFPVGQSLRFALSLQFQFHFHHS